MKTKVKRAAFIAAVVTTALARMARAQQPQRPAPPARQRPPRIRLRPTPGNERQRTNEPARRSMRSPRFDALAKK